ncbi:MAG: chemotaxis protein CheB, partial [Maribacter sp.]
GASAGGQKAIASALTSLSNTENAVFLVVVHGSMNGLSLFPKILSHKIKMEVVEAGDRMKVMPGKVYVAKPNHHLFVQKSTLFLSNGPRENLFRTSIDVLLRSAAVAYGNQCVGILLTGRLNDGTAGLEAIKKCAGIAIIQNPKTAEFGDMPSNAAQFIDIDYVVNIEDMEDVIRKVITETAPIEIEIPESVIRENSIAMKIGSSIALEQNLGHQVPISCATCGGPLWKIENSKVGRYRCHVGHAFTEEALLKSQNQALEEALWIAMRTLEEKKMLLERVNKQYNQTGINSLASTHVDKMEEVQKQINKLRNVLQIPD